MVQGGKGGTQANAVGLERVVLQRWEDVSTRLNLADCAPVVLLPCVLVLHIQICPVPPCAPIPPLSSHLGRVYLPGVSACPCSVGHYYFLPPYRADADAAESLNPPQTPLGDSGARGRVLRHPCRRCPLSTGCRSVHTLQHRRCCCDENPNVTAIGAHTAFSDQHALIGAMIRALISAHIVH
jgi:hypothetical protein